RPARPPAARVRPRPGRPLSRLACEWAVFEAAAARGGADEPQQALSRGGRGRARAVARDPAARGIPPVPAGGRGADAGPGGVLYGRASHAAFKLAEAGEVSLGGCLVAPANPRWQRPRCYAGSGRLAGTAELSADQPARAARAIPGVFGAACRELFTTTRE